MQWSFWFSGFLTTDPRSVGWHGFHPVAITPDQMTVEQETAQPALHSMSWYVCVCVWLHRETATSMTWCDPGHWRATVFYFYSLCRADRRVDEHHPRLLCSQFGKWFLKARLTFMRSFQHRNPLWEQCLFLNIFVHKSLVILYVCGVSRYWRKKKYWLMH